MIYEIISMNGYGAYVWSAFAFTIISNKFCIFISCNQVTTFKRTEEI